MPDTPYLLAAIGVSTAVTWGLRALPFAALAPLRASAVLHHLGARMPVGVMVILTVYSLRDLPLTSPQHAAPALLALAATLGLHLWRRNAVLSILGGTAVHVTLASTLLAHS
ncbi:AzlD domain-containing protein [Kitasatospora sp. NPDC047058]|uniref:branched-chain amino acid transporter permease n=1 Tax=Kitasatospora sp. NPDC047058 TaxID=3155620 RepID=UPI00340F0FB4